MDEWKLDSRVQERFLRNGELAEKDVQGFLRSLEDLEAKAEESSIESLLPKSLIAKLAGKAEESAEDQEGKDSDGKKA